jgi:hypothetical protein
MATNPLRPHRNEVLTSRAVLIDAHVHLHDCFAIPRFLEAAVANFTAAASALEAPAVPGCLLLADCAGARGFDRLRRERPRGWRLETLADGLSVRATEDTTAHAVLLMAGAQIRTAERLEVLGLITRARIEDGLTLQEAVSRVTEAGGVPVVPWGFGKWTFGRRKRLEAALHRPEPGFLLGDNGGRPLLRQPPLLAEAEQRGLPVLHGSDPLPFADHETRAGSCGFMLDAVLPEDAPAPALRSALARLHEPPPAFREARPLSAFVRDQLRMHLRRRGPVRQASA